MITIMSLSCELPYITWAFVNEANGKCLLRQVDEVRAGIDKNNKTRDQETKTWKNNKESKSNKSA